MWLIGLTISLFSIIKTRALECVSVINRKCMPRPKVKALVKLYFIHIMC